MEAVEEQPAKKLRLVGVLFNAASGCSSRSIYKDPDSKTMYCKEHHELLPKAMKKTFVSTQGNFLLSFNENTYICSFFGCKILDDLH